MSGFEKKKFDAMWIGAVVGLIAPLITLYVFYLIRYSRNISFEQFYTEILQAHNIVTPSISLCVIINLLVFFIFIWRNRNFNARGVLLATIIYAIYVMYQKHIK